MTDCMTAQPLEIYMIDSPSSNKNSQDHLTKKLTRSRQAKVKKINENKTNLGD